MPAGLKQAWGLSDAKKGSSDAQANAFRASFQAAIAPITAALGWTATNAEKAKHDPQSAARDKAYELYQSVLSRIDPSDESKAAGAIADALSNVSGLGSVVDGVKKVVEAAKKAWEAVADVLTEVVQKIGELEEWGMDGVGDLLSLVKKIQDAVANRAWEVARETLEQLKEKLQPLYEEYEKQKEAKEKYDKERPSLEEGFKAIKKAVGELPGKVADLVGQITKGFDGAGKNADDKDFVGAFGGIGGLGGLLDTLKKVADDLAKAEADYKKRVEGMKKKGLAELDVPVRNAEVEEIRVMIQGKRSEMETAAAGGDFVSALSKAEMLEGHLAAYSKRLAQVAEEKTKYEAKRPKLQANIDIASADVTNPTLEPKRTTILADVAAMDKLAGGENWAEALAKAELLEPELAGYKKGKDDHQAEKVQYEARRPGIDGRLKKVYHKTNNEDLLGGQTQLKDFLKNIFDPAVKAGNYDKALQYCDQTEAMLARYETKLAQHEKRKTEFTNGFKGMSLDLKTAKKAAPHKSLEKLQNEIVASEDKARKAEAADDYEGGLQELAWLGPALAGYKEAVTAMENAKEEYEKREPDLQTGLKAALGAKGIKNEYANSVRTQMNQDEDAMRKKASAGKYEDALADLFVLKADLAAYDAFMVKLEKLKTEYETRYGALETGDLKRVSEDVKHHALVKSQTYIGELSASAEKSALDQEYEVALATLDELESQVAAFNDFKADVEEERVEYDNRLTRLGLGKVDKQVRGTKLTAQKGEIQKAKAAMEKLAAVDDFDNALAKMDELEVELTKFDTMLEQQTKRKADYEGREPAVDGRVKTASAKTTDKRAVAAQKDILRLHASMKTAGGAWDFEDALNNMRALEGELAGYEALMASLAQDGDQGSTGSQTSQGGSSQTSKGGGSGGQSEAQESQSTTTSDTSDSNPFEQQSQNPFG